MRDVDPADPGGSFEGREEVGVVDREPLDAGQRERELVGEFAVRSADLRVAADEIVVALRVRGQAAFVVPSADCGDGVDDLGVVAAQGGVGEAEELAARVNGLQEGTKDLEKRLADSQAEVQGLRDALQEAQDDLIAAREAMRGVMREQNRPA